MDTVSFPRSALESSIPERFREIAAMHRNKAAIRFEGTTWTYGELDKASDHIAYWLSANTKPGPGPVILLCDQGADIIAAILGTLKAGKFYVPLDPYWPEDQLWKIIKGMPDALIFFEETYEEEALQFSSAVQAVQSIRQLMKTEATEPLKEQAVATSLTYVHFTSGSTGQPKGVIDCHRNVLHNVLRYTNSLDIGPADTVSLIHAPHYSACVSSIFIAMLNGATLCPINLRKQGLAVLPDWIIEEGIAVFHSVPEVFRKAVHEGSAHSKLRVVRLEGDRAEKQDMELYKRYCPDTCLLENGYGITETGLVSQYFANKESEVSTKGLPVGKPVEDMAIQVVDEAGQAVYSGEWGNVLVKSEYLSIGYWNNPDRTQKSGLLHGAYLTGDRGRILEDGNLELAERKLQSAGQFTAREVQTGQLTETEEILIGMWKQILGRSDIRATDHFLKTGGDSVKAIQLVAQLKRHFKNDFPLRLVFDFPILEDLAAQLDQEIGKTEI